MDGNEPSKEDLKALELAHYQKIEISDGIYVVNIGGYIGESAVKKLNMLNYMAKKLFIIADNQIPI